MAGEQEFGKYTILKKIATGGMGEIFLAKLKREDGFEKELILKRLLPHLSENDNFIEMFHNEARLTAQLSHQNIVQIFDFGQVDSSYYIALEYVHGETLADMLSKTSHKGLSVPRTVALEIVEGILRGLDYAHRKKGPNGEELHIIHRDISPKNILISFEGEVKIIDFGLAKAAAQQPHTEDGTLKGSYSYMSPEQVAGEPLDSRSDLFSLGTVAFEIFAGERLFPLEMGLKNLLEKIQDGDVTRFGENGENLWERIDLPLQEILLKSLASRPAERFQYAEDMLKRLEEYRRRRPFEEGTVKLRDFVRDLFSDKLAVENSVVEATEQVDRPDLSPPRRDASGRFLVRPRRFLFFLLLSLLVAGAFAFRERIERFFFPFSAPPASVSNVGRIRLATYPPGARVFLDGKPLAGKTNLVIDDLEPGEHVIRVEKEGYRTVERAVSVSGAQTRDLSLDLAGEKGQIYVVSNPLGARIILDGEDTGEKTPAKIEVPVAESDSPHTLRIVKNGYRPEEQTFVIESPDLKTIEVRLFSNRCRVKVESIPPGAKVFLDGEPRDGETPLVIPGLRPGKKREIRILLAGYLPWRKTILTEASKTIEIAARLREIRGSLLVRFPDEGSVHLGEILLGSGRKVRGPLPPGVHLVRLTDDFGDPIGQLRLDVKEKTGPDEETVVGLTAVCNLSAEGKTKISVDGSAPTWGPLAHNEWDSGVHVVSFHMPNGKMASVRVRLP